MSIKDLFKEEYDVKYLPGHTRGELEEEIESKEYFPRYLEQKERFIPPVDFDQPNITLMP